MSTIDAPQALRLTQEPLANVEHYDALSADQASPNDYEFCQGERSYMTLKSLWERAKSD